jgi:hypothetical protein
MPCYITVALQSVIDELGNPELGGRQLRSVYAVVSLLLGRQLDEAALSTDASLSRLETRLREDLRPAEGAEAGGHVIAAGRAIVKLTMSLPGETLPKFLMVSGVTKTLTDCIATHSSAEMRAWVITEVAAAAVRCWRTLDDRPFLNSGVYESGSEAQRAKQSLWDWIAEFFGSLVTLCEDENDSVAGAAFTALALPLQHYPLCQTALTHEISVLLHGSNSSACSSSSSTAGISHKESFPHQQIGETVLRLALPALPRMLLRQPALQRAQSPPAIHCCALLATAALRASTSLSGLPLKSKLMERARSRGLSSISAAGDAPQCCVPLQQCCDEWVQHTLVPLLQGLHAAETHAAVLALLQLLHTSAMRPLRSVLSVKAVAAVVAVMPALHVAQAHTAAGAQPLHAAQQELLAAAVVALRWVPHSAVSSVLPQLVQLVQQCPSADQRLGLLSDMFFVTMVSLPEGGRTAPTSVMEHLLEADWFDAALQALPPSDSANTSSSSVRANSGKLSFAQSNALVFREELVTAVTHTCACVVAAGAAAVLSLSAPAWTAITSSSSSTSTTTSSSTTITKAGAKHATAATTSTATAATGYLPAGIGRYAVQLAHYDPAAAAAARWLDLEHWLAVAALALSATGRCVNWVSSSSGTAAAGADGYTRLLVLVLRLASPAVGVQARAHLRWQPGSTLSGDDRLARAALRVARLDELEWKLHQGVPVRRVRLQLLAVMCRYLVSISDGGEPVGLGSPSQRQQVQQEHEDAATDLVSVLDTELRNLDAVAAASTNSTAEQHTGTAAAQSRSHTRRPWLVQEHRALVSCLVRLALAYEAAAAPVRAALQAEQARAYLRDGLGVSSKGIGPMAETVQQARRALDVVAHIGSSAAAVAAKPAALPHQFGALLLSVNGGSSAAEVAQRQQTALKLAVLTELPLPLTGDSTDETLTSTDTSSSSSSSNVASSIDTAGAISSRLARHFAGDAAAQQFSDLHAPQQQGFSQPVAVNGGSEPLLLTACYSLDPSWRLPTRQQQRSSSDSYSSRSTTRGITLRITAYNTTCSSITDTLTVQLSFGAGVSPACSPQASVTLRDRLLAGAAYTWDVPLAVSAECWCDLHISATTTLAQREPDAEFEADGALELLGGDGVSLMAEKSRAAAAAGNTNTSIAAGAGNSNDADGNGSSGPVPTPAVMTAGSYTVPAEALLVAGGTAVTRRLSAFQSHSSSLLHRVTLPVKSSAWLTALCQSPYECAQAMGGPVNPSDGTIVTELAEAAAESSDIELSADASDSARRRAWVLLPPALNAADYALVAAWAFETWQGAQLTVQLTAMKQPCGQQQQQQHSSATAAAQHEWIGRLEVRCDRAQCAAAVAAIAARFVAFVTNDAFELAAAADVLCSTSTQLPGRVGMQSYKAEAESRARVLPLWRALQQQ